MSRDRADYIGGSDASKVIGENYFASPKSVYEYIRGHDSIEDPEDLSENRHIMRGNACEPYALDRIREQHPSVNSEKVKEKFDEGGGIGGEIYIEHPKHEFVAGHTDGISIDPLMAEIIVHEVKAPTSSSISYIEKQGVPPRYFYQLQHYMGIIKAQTSMTVTGKLQIWSCDEWDLITLPIPFEEESFEHLLTHYIKMWNEARIEDIPFEESSFQVEDDRDLGEVQSEQISELLAEYYEIHRTFKQCKERKKELKAKILSQSKQAERLVGEDHYAEIKEYSDSTHLYVRQKD